jgi:hypothetical protein
MAGGGWGLSAESSPIRNIIPKEEPAWNAGASRKEGSNWKPEQTAKKSGRNLVSKQFLAPLPI